MAQEVGFKAGSRSLPGLKPIHIVRLWMEVLHRFLLVVPQVLQYRGGGVEVVQFASPPQPREFRVGGSLPAYPINLKL